MAIFYKSRSLSTALLPTLQDALTTDPTQLNKPASAVAADLTNAVQTQVAGELAVWRVVAAFAVLALIFFGGIWCEGDAGLKRWADALFETFKVGLPALIGLLIGEATSKGT